MLPQEIIRKKRDGEALTPKEIKSFVSGISEEVISEGQIAAFCMAVFLNKLSNEERIELTMNMADSGDKVDWSALQMPGPILDKHSTGGVGDKVSLILAPLIAACGGFVPMLAGRGLGHTGGTIDKLESIPGYKTQVDINTFQAVVRSAGCGIIGTTDDIAPADKRIYSVRDVTATVESLDLMVASILSKKLASGLGGLVVDVKFGSGAFMPEYEQAKELAQALVDVANGARLKTVAVLSDMNQVLGRTAGNALEIVEVIEFLKNETADYRLHDVVVSLAAEMLVVGNLAGNHDDAKNKVKSVLKTGRALEHFSKMVAGLGGDAAALVKDPGSHLKKASMVEDFYPDRKGYVTAMDVRAIGLGLVEIGGGRTKPGAGIDHSVGLSNVAQIGEEVGRGARPLATIHAKNQFSFKHMAKVLQDSVQIGDRVATDQQVVKERIEKK